MNKLYGLLTYKADGNTGWYAKRHSPVVHSTKSQAICDALIMTVSDDRLPLFASVVCKLAIESMFRNEILALDPDNTYCTVVRDPDAASGSPDDVMFDLTSDASTMNRLVTYLDQDIKSRLVAATWVESVSAACLQMLRDAL